MGGGEFTIYRCFKFAGRFLGLCIIDIESIGVNLSPMLIHFMQNPQKDRNKKNHISSSDPGLTLFQLMDFLEKEDEELCLHLRQLFQASNIENMEIYFTATRCISRNWQELLNESVSSNPKDAPKSRGTCSIIMEDVELIEGGSDILVSRENLEEFVRLKTMDAIAPKHLQPYWDSLALGFSEIVTRKLRTMLSIEEIQTQICGNRRVNVSEWRENVEIV